jgi:hypothetical protein
MIKYFCDACGIEMSFRGFPLPRRTQELSSRRSKCARRPKHLAHCIRTEPLAGAKPRYEPCAVNARGG